MDNRKEKSETLCYQILFNKPILKTKGKYIYGFRIEYNELKKPISEKLLMEYIVEAIFGRSLFLEIHDGSFEGEKDRIWIDKEGNEYKGYTVQTRKYSYDATVENIMNYRCDLVYAPCKGENDEHYCITDPIEYFEQKAKMDEEDHKSGKNQWMENYYRIQEKRKLLSTVINNKSEHLDYDIQDLIMDEWRDVKIPNFSGYGCPKLIKNEEYNTKKDDFSDELPF